MRWNNIRSFHKGEKRSENLYLSDRFNIKRQIKCLLTHGKYVIMNTETAGNLDFSWLPAFFVTNLLLVQCSI